jgi:hypothetical protein
MRRRYVFRRLDSDIVVRGIVYNKTDEGLIITLTRVCILMLSVYRPISII